jgi:hypothetical protein
MVAAALDARVYEFYRLNAEEIRIVEAGSQR